jgi:hypothetical protein
VHNSSYLTPKLPLVAINYKLIFIPVVCDRSSQFIPLLQNGGPCTVIHHGNGANKHCVTPGKEYPLMTQF